MATRAIVTSHPVVACDVCGRRLLRGETPDVFLAGGHRRTVCELCIPRATAEGWLREADRHELGLRAPRPRRAGSLLGRLRQLREPEDRPLRRESGLSRRQMELQADESALYDDVDELYEFVDGAVDEQQGADGQAVLTSAAQAERSFAAGDPQAEEHNALPLAAGPELTSGELKSERALEVFNAGATPRRVAGVSRSLGAPTVTVRPLQDAGARVAIIVAWELCWYRYEIDLGDEAAGAVLAAEGMELEELPDEDRLANAAASERGELALIAA